MPEVGQAFPNVVLVEISRDSSVVFVRNQEGAGKSAEHAFNSALPFTLLFLHFNEFAGIGQFFLGNLQGFCHVLPDAQKAGWDIGWMLLHRRNFLARFSKFTFASFELVSQFNGFLELFCSPVLGAQKFSASLIGSFREFSGGTGLGPADTLASGFRLAAFNDACIALRLCFLDVAIQLLDAATA